MVGSLVAGESLQSSRQLDSVGLAAAKSSAHNVANNTTPATHDGSITGRDSTKNHDAKKGSYTGFSAESENRPPEAAESKLREPGLSKIKPPKFSRGKSPVRTKPGPAGLR